jgi:hypothetical protein
MYDLNKSQSKIWVEKYLNKFMLTNGFVEKKNKNTDISYYKESFFGTASLNLGFLNSFPGTQIEYYYFLKISLVEDLVSKILIEIDPNCKKGTVLYTIGFNQASIDKIYTNSFMPEMVKEEDVEKSCNLIKHFFTNYGFPIEEKLSNINELDKEINGNYYWESDWRMPFTMGNDFPIKRLVIAKLAQNPNFEKLITFHLDDLNSKISKGEYVEIHKVGLKKLQDAVKLIELI